MIRSSFSIPGNPVGKPAWHNADKWQTGENARPAVQRYRDFCDEARAAATGHKDTKLDAARIYHIYIFAHIRMPESWSKKKKAALAGTIQRGKPDSDNITKATKDALFGEDKYISGDTTEKMWCHDDEEPRIDVFLLVSPEPLPTDEAECVTPEDEDGVT